MVESSKTSQPSGKPRTRRTNALTLAQKLEVLGDLLEKCEEHGLPIGVSPFATQTDDGVVKGIGILLIGCEMRDGKILQVDQNAVVPPHWRRTTQTE